MRDDDTLARALVREAQLALGPAGVTASDEPRVDRALDCLRLASRLIKGEADERDREAAREQLGPEARGLLRP